MSYYYDLFGELHKDLERYYHRWYFDRPMLVSPKRDEELHRITILLNRFLHFYVRHYREYLDIIPYSPEVLRILSFQEEYGVYRPGTARIDYVMDRDRHIKVCEITSRFFGNGYFLSYFSDKKGRLLAGQYGLRLNDDRMEQLLSHFVGYTLPYDRICLIKGGDRSSAIQLYVPFYEALGKQVTIMGAEDMAHEMRRGTLDGALLISTMNQKELLGLSDDLIRKLIDGGCLNDFRSVFLSHDKRILSLLFDDSVTDRFMNQEETKFIREHVIRTWRYHESEDIWEDARRNKDRYILKHYCLGKSEKVYAGSMTSDGKWEQLFADGSVREMILQPFILQHCCRNIWEGKEYGEYITGTILMLDDMYYGTGIFRSSSLEVLNKGDDRKIGYILTDNEEIFKGKCIVL